MVHIGVDLLVFSAAFLVGLPLLTLVHELAHAITAAALVGGRATVVQGPGPARLQLSVWRLDLRLHGFVKPHQVWVGWALWGAHPQRWRHALATLAGPASSAACALACGRGVFASTGPLQLVLVVLAAAAAMQTLSSGVPVRYGSRFGTFAGEASDGLRIRRLLEGRPEPKPLVGA
jgi:hypothetical protein